MASPSQTLATWRVLQGVLGIVLLVGLWWLLTVPFSEPDSMGLRFAPGPSLTTLIGLLQGGEIWIHIAVSLQRVAIGLGSVFRSAYCLAHLRVRMRRCHQPFSF